MGLTLEQLAERADLSPNYIGSVENERRDPSLSTILALAKALQVQAGDLLSPSHELSGSAAQAGRLIDGLGVESQDSLLAFLRTLPRRRR